MILDVLFNSLYSEREKFLIIVAFLLAVMLSIMLHEISHGFVAMKNGDYTAKYMGRLTLNPASHFDPIGFLMFVVVGIGWAKPVPVDSRNFKNHKRGTVAVSIAGVIMNLILATVCFFLFWGFGELIIEGLAVSNIFAIFFYYFLMYSVTVNLSLMAFNILPIYPLDGFRLVEALTPYGNRFSRFMRKNGQLIFIALLALGLIADNLGLPELDLLGGYIDFVRALVLRLFMLVGGLFA